MKNLTYFAITAVILLFVTGMQPKNLLKTTLDEIIEANRLAKTAVVSVSIREADSEKVIYERNAKQLLHPASTLKAFTTPVILEYLGATNQITTGLYAYNNNFYLKLSGDPLLTRKDLLDLLNKSGIKSVKSEIIIDDTAIDETPWGIGWMWDDENNPNMPKFNAYNLDRNLIEILVRPSSPPEVTIKPEFPVEIINKARVSDKTDIIIERRPWLKPEAIYVEGEISAPVKKLIPVASPEKYFIYNLKQALLANNINFTGRIKKGKLPTNADLVAEINHSVIEEVTHTNRMSDNLAAETLFKLMAKEYSGSIGTTKDGLKVFSKFYNESGVETSELFIVDSSGASHNDFVQTDWMSLALCKLYKRDNFNVYQKTLAAPNKKSTLEKRLTNLSGKLQAKTGTLAGISGLTGYLKGDSGKTYCFAILIQNYKGNSSPAKRLEDKIITTLSRF